MNSLCRGGQFENRHESRFLLSRGLSWSIIMLQSFAHAHDIVDRVTEPAIKLNHALVRNADLQIDFGAACVSKQSLRLRDNLRCQPTALECGSNGQVIEPAAMSFVTRHHRGHDLSID